MTPAGRHLLLALGLSLGLAATAQGRDDDEAPDSGEAKPPRSKERDQDKSKPRRKKKPVKDEPEGEFEEAKPVREAAPGDEVKDERNKDEHGKDERKTKHSKKREPRPKNARRNKGEAKAEEEHMNYGLALVGGWEATYGNAVTFTYFLEPTIGVTAALGYNNSGGKIGVGGEYLIPLHPSFGLRFGTALVESLGKKGEVSLDASFIPAGSDTAEAIVATKHYVLTPGTLLSAAVGGYFLYSPSLRVIAMVDYNIVLTGNKVTFDAATSYDKNVNVTNDADFSAAFDDKAKSIVRAGGLGAYLGVETLF